MKRNGVKLTNPAQKRGVAVKPNTNINRNPLSLSLSPFVEGGQERLVPTPAP